MGSMDSPPMSEPTLFARPVLTVSAAARACGVSRRTIHRRLAEHAFPSATQTPEGTWQIPIEDLLGAGFHLNAPTLDTPPDAHEQVMAGTPHAQAVVNGSTPEVHTLRGALTEAERRIAAAEGRANLAEAVATERLRTIEALNLALRALQAGPQPVDRLHDLVTAPAPDTPPRTVATRADAPDAKHVRWWHRRH
jgi:hypothetical protein